ncbi:MAG: transcription elongation factor GreA [Patescibacteria group bacterium]
MRICLTPEEFEKIKSELDTRINQKRKEIAARLDVAKELGDLSENTEYISAKEEQGFNEARIKELENLIRSAEVVKKNHNGKVCIGSQVKLKSDTGIHEFSVVGPEGIDLTNSKISYESPLGQALIGKKVGDTFRVKTPKGEIKYKIVEIK